jgi:hypothetical protein
MKYWRSALNAPGSRTFIATVHIAAAVIGWMRWGKKRTVQTQFSTKLLYSVFKVDPGTFVDRAWVSCPVQGQCTFFFPVLWNLFPYVTKHGVPVPSLPDFTDNFIMCLALVAVALVPHAPKNMEWPLYGYPFAIMRNCVRVGFDFRNCILYGNPLILEEEIKWIWGIWNIKVLWDGVNELLWLYQLAVLSIGWAVIFHSPPHPTSIYILPGLLWGYTIVGSYRSLRRTG